MSLQLRSPAHSPRDAHAFPVVPEPNPYAVSRPPRRWRRLVLKAGLAFMAGFGLTVVAMVWHHTAPDGWRVSQFIGDFSGDAKAAEIAASLSAEKAKTAALLEEQERMQKAVLQAQAQAQAQVTAAQSQAQQEVAAMQGRVQIAAAAYQTLYERSNKLAMIYAQTAQGFMQMRTELARANQGGSSFVANAADIMKGVAMLSGRSDLYERAEAIKQNATDSQMRELDSAMSRAAPTIDAQAFVAQGLPDPAQLAAVLNFSPRVVQPDPIEIGDRPAPPQRVVRSPLE